MTENKTPSKLNMFVRIFNILNACLRFYCCCCCCCFGCRFCYYCWFFFVACFILRVFCVCECPLFFSHRRFLLFFYLDSSLFFDTVFLFTNIMCTCMPVCHYRTTLIILNACILLTAFRIRYCWLCVYVCMRAWMCVCVWSKQRRLSSHHCSKSNICVDDSNSISN